MASCLHTFSCSVLPPPPLPYKWLHPTYLLTLVKKTWHLCKCTPFSRQFIGSFIFFISSHTEALNRHQVTIIWWINLLAPHILHTTPLEFLWWCVKVYIYRNSVDDNSIPCARIIKAIQNVAKEMLTCMWADWTIILMWSEPLGVSMLTETKGLTNFLN
jgi:hypothetical protein